MALVLCTGQDPAVMETRQLILEKSGHTVVLAKDEREIEKACQTHPFDVVVIGQNTTPPVKARIFRIARAICPGTKILELHRPFSDKALPKADAWLVMPTDAPEELAKVVTSLAEAE